MQNNSVTLHRVLKATPEKVYRAFVDAAAFASWIPPYGFVCVVHSMDMKVGGKYKMSFINVDFPLPDTPVTTINLLRGIDTFIFFRLCSLAPLIIILSFIIFFTS